MAKVPYSPVPEVAPAAGGPGPISVDTPAAAFGGASAQSLQGLGQQLERSGDEIFARAAELQRTYNEAEAREADTKYMIAAGELHAKFNAQQGKNAGPEVYQKYQDDLRRTREEIGKTLTNPHSRKLYDSSTLPTMGRTIFNGANHSANEVRQYSINSLKGQIIVDAESVEANPRDEVAFQRTVNQTKQNVANLAAADGWGEGQEAAEQQKQLSLLHRKRILGLSREEPFKAQEMLDEAIKKNQLTETDRLFVDNAVRGQARAVESWNIAQNVVGSGIEPDGTQSKTMEQMEEEASREARKRSPNDPILEKNARAAVQTLWRNAKTAKVEEIREAREVVNGAIRAGAPSEQALRADPKVNAMINRLPEKEQLALPGIINRYTQSRDLQDNNARDLELRGLSNSNVEAYLNLDMTQQKLSKAQIDWHMANQEKLKKAVGGDPRVNRAVNWMKAGLGQQMQALGVFTRKSDNPDDYDAMVGMVSDGLEQWIAVHKRQPTHDEFMTKIAPSILKSYTRPKEWWWGGNMPAALGTAQEPAFLRKVPPVEAAKMRADALKEGREEPDDALIKRTYNRILFNELFTSGKDQSKVPGK